MSISIDSGNGNDIVIPLWSEEIIINKRMVKLGEFVVKKNTKAPRKGNLVWMVGSQNGKMGFKVAGQTQGRNNKIDWKLNSRDFIYLVMY